MVMVYVSDLVHLFCKVMGVILFYQKNLLLTAKGKICPHQLRGDLPPIHAGWLGVIH